MSRFFEKQVLYRYYLYETVSADEWDYLERSTIRARLEEWTVAKLTPKGAWIESFLRERRWVSDHTKWVWETQEQAAKSVFRRSRLSLAYAEDRRILAMRKLIAAKTLLKQLQKR